ncbi:cbs domain containing protein [Tunicatimonas pelagia]|uniref:cbs domain containing protein n=1 Tax=Tunicatimonas pelagia TaxID=931531 RepID=UPI0026665C3C|nr:cbs domain containing protein [Tunicatimonas pelagia]WKN44562.1 cbs domain containing protein [Tunicatimonas pelagia]
MNTFNFVNPLIPILKPEDNIAKATALLDDQVLNQLPVVHEGQFQGFITSDMLFDDLFDHSTVGEYQLNPNQCIVYSNQHFYEVVKAFSDCDFNMLALVDENQEYLGAFDAQDLLNAFSKTTAVQSPGSIIEISIKQIDYSLAEITRLIESDGVKIMGCFLQSDAIDSNLIRLTLKLDRKDASRTVATLERFSYNVVSLFQEASVASYDKERLDALLRYLDI